MSSPLRDADSSAEPETQDAADTAAAEPTAPEQAAAPGPSRRSLLLGGAATAAAAGTAAATGTGNPLYGGVSGQPLGDGGNRKIGKLRPRPNRKEDRIDKSAAGSETVDLSVLVYSRLAMGHRPGDLQAFDALGGSDDVRLEAWIDQQLNPGGLNYAELNGRIAAANFTTLNKSRSQLWNDHVVNNTDRSLPREEIERATFLRALYSPAQMVEVLADFWHNHFNVDAGDFWAAPMWVHYDRDVIRGHLLGNYRDFLQAVAQSTPMLYYLDNYTSSNAGPNENFCRELFELHAMGADNYLGIRQQNTVPTDGQGRPVAYVDADVFEATRAFTGWSVSNSSSNAEVGNTGEFHYRAEWHDRFQKTVLGVFMPADQPPLKDGMDVLDALAEHPGTASYICGKLCRRLTVDNPPQTLIDTAISAWQTHIDAPDQLARVVRAIVLAPEFRDGWGEKAKRPFEITCGALRAVGTHLRFRVDEGDTNAFLNRYNDCGQELFRWPAPNGYPDVRGAWQSNTPRAITWRLMQWLMDFDDDSDLHYLDVVGQTPPGVRTATTIADYWIDRIYGRPLQEEMRQELIDFMGQGINPDFELPLTTSSSTAQRLRALVGLMMMLPNFLWK